MEAIQADCDVKATNIILQGLPPKVYALVSNHKVAKELWKRIQLLMQGTSLTKQEREYSGLIVPVFQKGNDPNDAINHMMSFLTAVVTSRGDTHFFSCLVHQEHTHQEQMETILGNKGLFSAITTKEKATCPNSALNQRGKGMSHGSRIRCIDSDCDVINTAKVALIANLSHYGSDDLAESNIVNQSETEITSDSNIIPYSQYKEEYRNIDREITLEKQIKELNNIVFKRNQSAQTVHMLTKPQFFYDHTTKQALETLMLAEESHSKMLLKQKDPMMSEKKVNTKPVDYANSVNSPEPTPSTRATQVEVPKELLKVSTVNTRVKLSTSASGSHPSSNTKKDKTQQTPSSTKKNKIEAHSRSVRSSLRNKKCVVKTKNTASVQNSKSNVNFDLQCVTCNGCLFSDNHDSCVLEFINNMNARVKSKSVKKTEKRKVWKPTGKVFTNIGYIWILTGRTFTIVENACSLTRITTTAKVPLRKPISLESNPPKPLVTLVYSRKPKESRNNVSASKTKSWLWHRRLSHLNFGAINHLARQGLVQGLPKLKFEKDHLCSACAMGKSKKKSHKPKSEDTNQEKLYLLRMDLCGPMRVKSVNGKKYILIIIDDYSQFTWVKCLRSKDEAPDFIIKFLKMIQVRLKVPVRRIRTYNGTEFVNQTLRKYYEQVDISHEISVALSPQQNGVVKRRNRTLIEAARTMLIYARAPLFLWAEVVATACFTQNRSIICLRHNKTPYELLHNKLPDLSYMYVFGALCYPTNDSENLGKLQPKADIGIFIGYAPTKIAFRIYNRRTRQIIKTIHVDFNKLTTMVSEQSSSGPALHEMTSATISSGLVLKFTSSTSFVPPSRTDWDLFFEPLFDELLTLPPSVDHPAPEVIAPIPEVVAQELAASTGSPSSTTFDQDAPSPSNSQSTLETQPPVILNDVEEDNHDIEVAHMSNDSYFGITIPEATSEQSSSTDVIYAIVHPDHQISKHNSKWTNYHPLENIIGELAQPVSTRLQLHEQALFCYYDAFFTSVEPKTYKDALTQSRWIEAMQEELNEFERLEVWELVPRPDKVMVITLK
nr:putative ribonuclease H-like domain-containing protein [Tanacetum cinerariifolium]